MAENPLDLRVQTICLLILTTAVVAAALRWLSPAVIPFVLALFLTQCLMPVVDFLTLRLRVPHWAAVALSALLGCLIIVFLGAIISTTVTQMAANAPVYQEQIGQLMRRAEASLPLERMGIDPERFRETMWQLPEQAAGAALGGIARAIMNLLSNGLVVLIFMIFMVVGRPARTVPPRGLLGEIEWNVRRYIVTKLIVSAATGVLVGSVLFVLGVDFALTFGFLAFLLNFIPNIGSAVATLLPLPVVLLDPELSNAAKVLAIVIPGVIQFTVGNLVEPKMMGQSLDLHPVTVLVSLIVFGMIWGIVGMFLATPITAILKILCERFEITAPIADIMGGRLDALERERPAAKPARP